MESIVADIAFLPLCCFLIILTIHLQFLIPVVTLYRNISLFRACFSFAFNFPGLLTGLVIDSGDGVTHVVNY